MSTSTQPAYKDANRPTAERVEALLSLMTLDEKLAQLGSVWAFELLDQELSFSPEKGRKKLMHGLGQITRVGGSSNLLPEETAELANAIQRFLAEETRLGIPAMDHEECCSGYMARGAMVYPQAIGLASTWVPGYAERMAAYIREEMRAIGAHQALAPVLDVTRDPRWGRAEETFGEDHRLVADMGVAYVSGLQGDGPGRGGIIATAKHFVGYGLAEGGMNWAPAHIPPRELREVFVYPFEQAIQHAQLGSVMNAYHELDGVPCGADEALLTDLLHDVLGFDGIVVSDYFAIEMLLQHHKLAQDKVEAAVMSLRAGIDVELPSTECYGAPLRQALEEGRIEERFVDRAVRRMLTAKFDLGLFENPYVEVERVRTVFARTEPQRLATEIAEKSFVLLKNEPLASGDTALPIGRRGTLAVIGPNADSARNMMGDYAYPAHVDALLDPATLGSSEVVLPEGFAKLDYFAGIPSVLDGLREVAGTEVDIRYAAGCEIMSEDRSGFDAAVDAARGADLAVLVMGGRSGLTDDCTCGEARDRAEIGLPGVQEELVRAVAATGTPVVLVLVAGRPFALSGVVDHVAAILHCWLPGQVGGHAVARALFGETTPGGKLPISLPRAAGQIPVYYNHKPSGGRTHWKEDYVGLSTKPLFAFGHGLSYTEFAYRDLKISSDAASAEGHVTVQCLVENTGARTGDEVVQVYAHDLQASLTRPLQQLVAYDRITLKPGETRTVTLEVPVERFGFIGLAHTFVVEPGEIELQVGSASNDIRLRGRVMIEG